MEIMAFDVLALLFLVGLLAGWVDSIAGGGGLLALPALLWAGLTPAQALATNKLQGSFGTFAATTNFVRKGHLDLKAIWPMILLTFIGSACGTLLVQALDASALIDVIPFLLLGMGFYFLLQPEIGAQDQKARMGLWGFSFTCGFSIGFYDGFSAPAPDHSLPSLSSRCSGSTCSKPRPTPKCLISSATSPPCCSLSLAAK